MKYVLKKCLKGPSGCYICMWQKWRVLTQWYGTVLQNALGHLPKENDKLGSLNFQFTFIREPENFHGHPNELLYLITQELTLVTSDLTVPAGELHSKLNVTDSPCIKVKALNEKEWETWGICVDSAEAENQGPPRDLSHLASGNTNPCSPACELSLPGLEVPVITSP